MTGWTIGIIGGSGLYALPGLEDAAWHDVATPWGPPSDRILSGRLGTTRLLFLPRHGRGHRIPPGEIDARANIDALKRLGATDLLAISSVGSLREELAPGRFAVVDQFIDRTVARPPSFFGTGLVAHVGLADPVCPRLAAFAAAAISRAGGAVAERVTYLAMEGPQFSTRAESRLYRHWGADLIGMTALPEARLAREAELPYALIGMVTDYDSWREEAPGVEASDVVARMHANADLARRTIAAFAAALPPDRTPSPIDTVLDHALLTAPEARDPAMVERLDAILSRLATGKGNAKTSTAGDHESIVQIMSPTLRRSLCQPIPAIFEVAGMLMDAVDRHLLGDATGAVELLQAANSTEVRTYTNQAWGKGSLKRYGFIQVADTPRHLSLPERSTPRMPTTATKNAVIARDGHHCRFCGIPVIDAAVRKDFVLTYPEAVRWNSTNESQHAAFQCMWLQFDHILPNGRGGDSSIDNVVIACAPCNFGRMQATLEEARLVHPLTLDSPIVWPRHANWDGLERFRASRQSVIGNM